MRLPHGQHCVDRHLNHRAAAELPRYDARLLLLLLSTQGEADRGARRRRLPCDSDSSPGCLGRQPPNWNPKQTQAPDHPLAQAVQVPASAQVSPCEGPVELCQLVVDDDSDNEDDAGQSGERPRAKFHGLGAKLMRHMSQDDETARRSRMAVGHSQGELARRAELRRFRQKRIQHELEKEATNDDSSNRSHPSTRYLSPLIDLGQPGAGPRDTIEFTVDDGSAVPDPALPAQQDSYESGQRRSSCPELAKRGKGNATSNSRSDDDGQAPAAPSTTPVAAHASRPSTVQNTSPRRLAGYSHSSPRLDRVLGTDNDFDIRHGSHAWDDQSALGIWLIAQGLRSRDNSLIRLGDPESDRATDRERVRSPSQDFGGIDSIIDTPAPTQENSTPAPSSSRDGWENVKASRCPTQAADSSNSDFRASPVMAQPNVPSSETPPEARAPSEVPKQPIDNASSNYPSVMASFQPSPACSMANNYSLSPQDIENLELSPFQWYGNFSILRDLGRSEGQSSYATAEDDTSNAPGKDTAAPSLRHPSQGGPDNNSVAQSETTSFQQREAELKTIEQRFGEVMARKQAESPPVHSRFKEDFTKSAAHAPARTSLVAKLQNSISRLSRVGSYSFGSTDHRRSASVEVDPKLLPEAERAGAKDTDTLSTSDGMGNTWTKTRPNLSGAACRAGSKQTLPSSQDAAQETCFEASAHEPQDASRQPMQLRPNGKRRGTSDGARGKGGVRGLATPPEPWVQFASRGQQGRMQGAARDDGVATQDFALTGPRSGERKSQATGEGEAPGGHGSRPLPKRLEKAVRTGLNKFLPSRMAPDHESASQPEGTTTKTRRKEADADKGEPATWQGPGQTLMQRHDETPSAESLVCRPMVRVGNHGETSQSTTQLVPSGNTCDASATPMSETVVTPLSRVQLDATADVRTLDGCESIKSDSRTVVRRWKLSEGQVSRKERSSTWTVGSSTQTATAENAQRVDDWP